MTDLPNSLVANRYVRILCDYGCEGVWNIRGEACDINDLPVKSDLAAMILAWQTWFEHSEPGLKSPIPFDNGAHAAFGLFLARRVKEELPDWTVVYFDAARSRHDSEYEIILNTEAPKLLRGQI